MVIPTLERVQRRAQRLDGRVEHLRDWPSKMGYGSQATESEVGIRDWPSRWVGKTLIFGMRARETSRLGGVRSLTIEDSSFSGGESSHGRQ